MKKILLFSSLIIFYLFPIHLTAGQIKTIDGIVYEYNDSLSFKNFSGRKFLSGEIKPGTTIYSSVFMSENPNTVIFPNDMINVTFYKCNLDNIVLPIDNKFIECNNRNFKIQNDLEDWFINKQDLKPIEPIMKDLFIELGISTNTADIPKTKLIEPITKSVKEGTIDPKSFITPKEVNPE